MKRPNDPVITVDGASGTGKGTVSLLLATHLGWNLLDSGALYRVLALAVERHQIALDNENALEVLAEHLDVQFIAHKNHFPDIILEGEAVTDTIRDETIGNAASIVAALPAVRGALLGRQRAFRKAPGLVADGRDMGTVIFPDAEFKFFLLASAEERAKRRYTQLKGKGINVTLSDLLEELLKRDRRDQERPIAPLKPAIAAICIDTDHLSAEQVVAKILEEINEKKALTASPDLKLAEAV